MGEVIAQSDLGEYSTWGKLRCPLINGYDQFSIGYGTTPQPHNLTIDSGFHPDGGLFLRVNRWPFDFQWFDVNSNVHTEYDGPIVGFFNTDGVINSHFSIGAYDWNGNEIFGTPAYTSINNFIDQSDIDDSLIGLTVTYSSGTFATNADAFTQTPPVIYWLGQEIDSLTITAVTDITSFTAF